VQGPYPVSEKKKAIIRGKIIEGKAESVAEPSHVRAQRDTFSKKLQGGATVTAKKLKKKADGRWSGRRGGGRDHGPGIGDLSFGM